MTSLTLAILLIAVALVLFAAESLLPTHGVVGLMGAAALVAAAVVCFRINQYLGLAVVVGTLAALPFAGALWVKFWPRTPIGRRLFLPPVAKAEPAAAPVTLGQTGTVVSELRPMGICDFGGQRLEARAEHGVIPGGRRVEVIAVVDRRPTVRAV